MTANKIVENFEKMLRTKVEIPQDLKDKLDCYVYNTEENITFSVVEESSESYYWDAIAELKSTPLSETFQELLFSFIDKSGLSDVEVYKKAFIFCP